MTVTATGEVTSGSYTASVGGTFKFALVFACSTGTATPEVRRVTPDATRDAWAEHAAVPPAGCKSLSFTNVNGRWVQVVITCPGIDEGTKGPAFWVGLDGYPHLTGSPNPMLPWDMADEHL